MHTLEFNDFLIVETCRPPPPPNVPAASNPRHGGPHIA